MKVSTGCLVSAGLVLAAATANAQLLTANGSGGVRYTLVSGFEGPYAELPPEVLPAPLLYGPPLLPPQEVYAVVRANGFQPLGMVRQRGAVYMIAATAPDGEDGRIVMDARNGHIIRFVPSFSMRGFEAPAPLAYGAARAMEPLPPPSAVRGPPRPPVPIPHVASRSVPLPKLSPPRATEVARETERERSTEVPKLAAKPAFDKSASEPVPKPVPETQTAAAPQTTGTINQPKPVAPAILPTQQMPAAQGLD